jgi:hypothetical protein
MLTLALVGERIVLEITIVLSLPVLGSMSFLAVPILALHSPRCETVPGVVAHSYNSN